ncbi:MAG: AAA family ATPase [Acidimicrobiales bacterium]
MSDDQATWFSQTFEKLVANIEQAVLGKTHVVRLALTCLFAEGHFLLEDVPGTGKTSLARALANTIQSSHSRIQFTPDLLPSDVTGVTIYNQRTGVFDFHRGPIFAAVVLADEINRASPKTQSALLEVMEERQVTVDGVGHDVGAPFMVLATQNSIEQAGTYRLPEAQLDRFLMKSALGYPDHQTTIALLSDAENRDRAAQVEPLITAKAVTEMSALAATVFVSEPILAYISRMADETRQASDIRLGVSMRGCLAMVRCAKVWAAGAGRNYVVPDDIRLLFEPVFCHRVLLDPEAEFAGLTASSILARLLEGVKPPSERAA